jgi:hypothetical protein
VAAGPGTVKVGGENWRATDMQKGGRGHLWNKKIKEKEADAIAAAVHDDFYGGDAVPVQGMVDAFQKSYAVVTGGETLTGFAGLAQNAARASAARIMIGQSQIMAKAISNPELNKEMTGKSQAVLGLSDPRMAAMINAVTGGGFNPEELNSSAKLGAMGAEAQLAAEGFVATDRIRFMTRLENGYTNGDRTGMPMEFHRLVQQNKHSVAADKLYLDGKKDEANKEMQMARVEAQVEISKLNPELRGVKLEQFDYDKKAIRPEAAAVAAALRVDHELEGRKAELVKYGRAMGDAGFVGVQAAIMDEVEKLKPSTDPALVALRANSEKAAKLVESDIITVGGEVKKETATVGARHKRGGDGGGMSRAIGFGEQEAAMDRIQRALASTEKGIRSATGALSTVEKRISKIESTPQVSKELKLP